MNMTETVNTYFQVPPTLKQWCGERVVFMNDAFDLSGVKHISPVKSYAGVQHYYFEVDVIAYDSCKQLRYDFSNRANAVQAHRQLTQAYTHTGEYEYDKENTPTCVPELGE